jgi:uncharacterized protein (UPF0303 family)
MTLQGIAMNKTLQTDLERIAEQERYLVLEQGLDDLAWRLGSRLYEQALARGLALVLEVRLLGQTVFFLAMPGTAPSNTDWARRKRNTTELLNRSSYGIGLELEQKGQTLEQTMGLPLRDYATHGGSFPLKLKGLGTIGSITVSGAPQREDHALVVAVLAECCGLDPQSVALQG